MKKSFLLAGNRRVSTEKLSTEFAHFRTCKHAGGRRYDYSLFFLQRCSCHVCPRMSARLRDPNGTSALLKPAHHARSQRRAYARVSASDGFSVMWSSRDAQPDPAASQAPRYASGSLTPNLPLCLRPVFRRTRHGMVPGNVRSGRVTNTCR